jgi:Secretion system C-terminal sorting domain/Pregnancy-associated plasma protein-A/Cleaved Adhesin Domain
MKKITYQLMFLSLASLSTGIMFGQKRPVQEKNSNELVRCYSVENEAALRTKYPTRQTTDEFESWLAPQIMKFKAERASGKNVQAIYNIPVVIHIIHDGDDVGNGENITDAQAISQITVMNQDFRRIAATPGGANTTGLAVDVEINFVLAQKDPAGNPSSGVVRHTIIPPTNAYPDGNNGADWELRTEVETMKSNTQWDPTKYLNMWTIRPGGNGLTAATNPGLTGLLGYAQFPSSSGLAGVPTNAVAANTDGVVSSYDAMGTIALNDGSFALIPTYNLGRTMTHEVGHWLGLRHIWGDDTLCPATNSSTDKDFCADTPAANTPNYTCNLSANTCASNPGNDQVQNYMDYTNDACMDTFTNDQKTRMQTVMSVSPRRNTLNASTASIAPSAGIYFKKTQNAYSPIEGTNCSYTDVSYPVSIIKAPTANAVVTFTVNAASTAVLGKDFDIVTPTVTIPSGSTASQNLIVRYYNDGLNESNEKVVIGMTVNANGGDAVIIPGYNEDNPSLLTCKIIDNDVVPQSTQQVITFSENFDGTIIAPRTLTDRDGDTKNWGIYLSNTSSVAWGLTGRFAGSKSWDSVPSPGGTALTPDNLMTFTSPITIPVGSPSLSFRIGANDTTDFAENYAVYITSSNVPNTIVAQTPVIQQTLTSGGSTSLKTVSLSAFAGQNVYLSFRHFGCTNQNLLLLDDISISNTVSADVQTVVNTATQYQATINTTGTTYAKDASTGKIIADITSTTNYDYGCTTASVSRDQATAGAGAVNYGANTANNLKVMAKTVTILPATNNASGTGNLKFYFSEAEIAAWETSTGNLRSALKIFKGGAITTIPATIGAFGSNVTLTGNFSNGISGVYYFGTDATLANPEFEFTDFSLFPNPNDGKFTIQLNSESNDYIKINIHDLRGRQVYENSYTNTGAFNQNISLDKIQSGVYLISITDGTKKTVKRIVLK